MSSSCRRAVARPMGGTRLFRAGPLLVALLILLLAVRGAVRADPPAAVSRISGDEARSTGVAVILVRHATADGLLVEASLPPALRATNLLSVAPDGQSVALSGTQDNRTDDLLLAAADGSQLRIRVPSVRAAAFSPAGDWLFAIDGGGALWQVDTLTGEPGLLADGPFAGRPVIAPDGSILLLAVSSIEAPIVSQLVRLDRSSGTLEPASYATLVYGVFPLADGSIAFSAHQPGGTVVRRLAGDEEIQLADLGPNVAHVAVAASGWIAFERAGLGVFVVDPSGSPPRHLSDGERPTFAPNGSAILIATAGGVMLVALDGSLIGSFGPQTGFASCPAGCPS